MIQDGTAPTTAQQQALEDVAAQVRQLPAAAPLYKGALKGVPGEGDPDAEVMLIGEAPGWHENQQGRPFVGAAGQFLNDLLRSVGLRREQVFIANVIKHRPPDNRDPLPDELAACLPYLDRQIEVDRPAGDRDPGPLLDGPVLPRREDQPHPRRGQAPRRPHGAAPLPPGGGAAPGHACGGRWRRTSGACRPSWSRPAS